MDAQKFCSKGGFGRRSLPVLTTVAAVALMASGPAGATSIITADMATSLSAGFTDLQDTAVDVVAKVWPYMLGILAVYAAPQIVKKLWNMAAKG